MYTIAVKSNGQGQERYIGHRGTYGEAEALAEQWVQAASEHGITHVYMAREGERIACWCTGYQAPATEEQRALVEELRELAHTEGPMSAGQLTRLNTLRIWAVFAGIDPREWDKAPTVYSED